MKGTCSRTFHQVVLTQIKSELSKAYALTHGTQDVPDRPRMFQDVRGFPKKVFGLCSPRTIPDCLRPSVGSLTSICLIKSPGKKHVSSSDRFTLKPTGENKNKQHINQMEAEKVLLSLAKKTAGRTPPAPSAPVTRAPSC